MNMVVRGVPKGLAKDAWWMDDETAPPGLRWLPGILLLVVVTLVDVLVWRTTPGLGLVVWIIALAAAVQTVLWDSGQLRRSLIAWVVLLISLVPLVELFQFLSVLFAVAGLTAFAVIMVLGNAQVRPVLRAMVRLPLAGFLQTLRDLLMIRVPTPSTASVKGGLRDWVVPGTIGVIFIALMGAANPIVDSWLAWLSRLDIVFHVEIERWIFWGMVAVFAWPLLRLAQMAERLARRPKPRAWNLRSGFINDRSVLRALLMFNLIFAVQTVTDLGYLWGGVSLPDGMTYADYAHRGAYPLIVVALLAGVFALIAQPFLKQSPLLRVLLYIWIAQTVLLVVSSILRLDLYVDAYGLTRLRFVAFVWMIVVALGLMLIMMQMWVREATDWFALRAAGLGLVALYAVSLVNVDGFVARNQMGRAVPDLSYVCGMGQGAAVATKDICNGPKRKLTTPDDWREWGYRNARLRNTVNQMNSEATQ